MTKRINGNGNKLHPEDRAIHDWYRFVLSFPPQLVREYIGRFGLDSSKKVLDPFCGTGSTLVECKKLGISSVGIEFLPMAYFASRVKVNWAVDAEGLLTHAMKIAERASALNKKAQNLRTLPTERFKLLIKDSISPLPLHKTLLLLNCLQEEKNSKYFEHELLALANAIIKAIGNLRFGPEVGIGDIKEDAPVINLWLSEIRNMESDLRKFKYQLNVPAEVFAGDSRNISDLLPASYIDAVITSPPYPNEKDYTRTTRLESVLLGFIQEKADLRKVKNNLIRSNTRSVYHSDEDDKYVEQFGHIRAIADKIESRRLELGKTSGFERLYGRLTKLYFGGIYRHLSQLRHVLKPGADLAYVVGDQASYLQVMIRTGEILGEIAENLGYKVIDIDLFRTRYSTATKSYLREEVVIFRWDSQLKRIKVKGKQNEQREKSVL